jgi:hypothetical protein
VGDGAPPVVREWVKWGAGPRAGQALLLGAKAMALFDGRAVPSLDDIRAVTPPVLPSTTSYVTSLSSSDFTLPTVMKPALTMFTFCDAVQMIPLRSVARIRADHLVGPLSELSTPTQRDAAVPKRALAPGPIVSEEALGSLAAPPAELKISTPTRMLASVVLVHAKNVSTPQLPTTPGTEYK